MRVQVVHPAVRLPAQARRVEVVDVRDVGVEQVERFERHAGALVDVDADLAVPDRRRFGRHAVVLDQRARAEVTQANAAEDAFRRLHRQGARDDPVERARNRVAGRIVVGEPRGGERKVGLGRHPRCQAQVVRPFKTVAVARSVRLGDAGVADEQQFRIEVQVPQRHRRLQPADSDGPHAELAAARLHQRAERLDRLAGPRIHRQRRTAHVVAVEALSPVGVELGLPPRPEDRGELGTDDGAGAGAGVQRVDWPRCRSDRRRRAARASVRNTRLHSISLSPNRPIDVWRKASSRTVLVRRCLTVSYSPMRPALSWRSCTPAADSTGRPRNSPRRRWVVLTPIDVAAVRLPRTDPVDGVDQEIGEVLNQVQPVAHGEPGHAGGGAAGRAQARQTRRCAGSSGRGRSDRCCRTGRSGRTRSPVPVPDPSRTSWPNSSCR